MKVRSDFVTNSSSSSFIIDDSISTVEDVYTVVRGLYLRIMDEGLQYIKDTPRDRILAAMNPTSIELDCKKAGKDIPNIEEILDTVTTHTSVQTNTGVNIEVLRDIRFIIHNTLSVANVPVDLGDSYVDWLECETYKDYVISRYGCCGEWYYPFSIYDKNSMGDIIVEVENGYFSLDVEDSLQRSSKWCAGQNVDPWEYYERLESDYES